VVVVVEGGGNRGWCGEFESEECIGTTAFPPPPSPFAHPPPPPPPSPTIVVVLPPSYLLASAVMLVRAPHRCAFPTALSTTSHCPHALCPLPTARCPSPVVACIQVVVSSVTLPDWSALLPIIKAEIQQFPVKAGWGVAPTADPSADNGGAGDTGGFGDTWPPGPFVSSFSSPSAPSACRVPCVAVEANFLEAINVVLDDFLLHHIDRDLHRLGREVCLAVTVRASLCGVAACQCGCVCVHRARSRSGWQALLGNLRAFGSLPIPAPSPPHPRAIPGPSPPHPRPTPAPPPPHPRPIPACDPPTHASTLCQIVVVTAGSAVFEVASNLSVITENRMMDVGSGCDLICVGELPLHRVPLFIVRPPDPPPGTPHAHAASALLGPRPRGSMLSVQDGMSTLNLPLTALGTAPAPAPAPPPGPAGPRKGRVWESGFGHSSSVAAAAAAAAASGMASPDRNTAHWDAVAGPSTPSGVTYEVPNPLWVCVDVCGAPGLTLFLRRDLRREPSPQRVGVVLTSNTPIPPPPHPPMRATGARLAAHLFLQ
jgi:hypothetical protein